MVGEIMRSVHKPTEHPVICRLCYGAVRSTSRCRSTKRASEGGPQPSGHRCGVPREVQRVPEIGGSVARASGRAVPAQSGRVAASRASAVRRSRCRRL